MELDKLLQTPYSAYDQTTHTGTASLQARFRHDLAAALGPVVDEVVTERTHSLQMLLLVTASLLSLLSLSLVEVSQELTASGLTFTVAAHYATPILFTVTAYLEILVLVRSLLDWRAFRLRVGAAELYIAAAERLARTAPVPSASNAYEEAVERFVDETSADYEPHSPEAQRKQDLARKARHEQREELKAYSNWITENVRPLQRLNRTRRTIEVFFPVVFGALALALAIVTARLW